MGDEKRTVAASPAVDGERDRRIAREVLEQFEEEGRGIHQRALEYDLSKDKRILITTKPPKGSQPLPLQMGNFVDDYAELIIPASKLPRGLKREFKIYDGGFRNDAIDTENGIVYEIKPDSVRESKKGQLKVDRVYLKILDKERPLPNGRKWRGRVVTYDRKKALELAIKFGYIEDPGNALSTDPDDDDSKKDKAARKKKGGRRAEKKGGGTRKKGGGSPSKPVKGGGRARKPAKGSVSAANPGKGSVPAAKRGKGDDPPAKPAKGSVTPMPVAPTPTTSKKSEAATRETEGDKPVGDRAIANGKPTKTQQGTQVFSTGPSVARPVADKYSKLHKNFPNLIKRINVGRFSSTVGRQALGVVTGLLHQYLINKLLIEPAIERYIEPQVNSFLQNLDLARSQDVEALRRQILSKKKKVCIYCKVSYSIQSSEHREPGDNLRMRRDIFFENVQLESILTSLYPENIMISQWKVIFEATYLKTYKDLIIFSFPIVSSFDFLIAEVDMVIYNTRYLFFVLLIPEILEKPDYVFITSGVEELQSAHQSLQMKDIAGSSYFLRLALQDFQTWKANRTGGNPFFSQTDILLYASIKSELDPQLQIISDMIMFLDSYNDLSCQ